MWKQTVEELGIAELLGEDLLAVVERIFGRHELTPSAAADELEGIAGQIQALSTNLDQLVTAFEWFKVGSEKLDPGEFEVGLP